MSSPYHNTLYILEPHWRKIWSNNPLKRPSHEIRRRTDVADILPNRPAARRLVDLVLAEQNNEWDIERVS